MPVFHEPVYVFVTHFKIGFGVPWRPLHVAVQRAACLLFFGSEKAGEMQGKPSEPLSTLRRPGGHGKKRGTSIDARLFILDAVMSEGLSV